MPERRKAITRLSKERRTALRHQALQIASMLPDDTDESLYVLFAARHIVVGYLDNDLEAPRGIVTPYPAVVGGKSGG